MIEPPHPGRCRYRGHQRILRAATNFAGERLVFYECENCGKQWPSVRVSSAPAGHDPIDVKLRELMKP